MTRLYYTAPSDEAFEDMKSCALETWREVAEHPSYLEEKVSYVSEIRNIGDNFMTIFAMFDDGNQRICGAKLKQETKDELNKRLIDGGSEYAIIN